MRRIAVRAVVVHQGQMLLVRLKKKNSNEPVDFWCTPGGGLDDNESLHAGLRRELVEELGVEPQIGKLLFVQQYRVGDKEYLEFFFEVTNTSDYLHIDLAATTHGQQEICELGFRDPSSLRVLPEFLQEVTTGMPDTPRFYTYL